MGCMHVGTLLGAPRASTGRGCGRNPRMKCTFDGLRYGAAFIGFDHFHIIRQGLLLFIDTFGVSHILPVLSLPFITIFWHNTASKNSKVKNAIANSLIQVLLMYGLITSITTTLTIICVTIQRRHLMVWGLFAPKYLTLVLILQSKVV
ncbi:hypothetical protein GUJ93_ZPchr0010g7705 [Zizania palustris]|uniref:Uncharacterized protein n=1 Tax=Zizania palustris TaxID=103762 RepID=A0A8J6BMU2_ZIZPA|nr:hypothetical protein GUJ93_ZPchr0010g7705 [Zizania palustris]